MVLTTWCSSARAAYGRPAVFNDPCRPFAPAPLARAFSSRLTTDWARRPELTTGPSRARSRSGVNKQPWDFRSPQVIAVVTGIRTVDAKKPHRGSERRQSRIGSIEGPSTPTEDPAYDQGIAPFPGSGKFDRKRAPISPLRRRPIGSDPARAVSSSARRAATTRNGSLLWAAPFAARRFVPEVSARMPRSSFRRPSMNIRTIRSFRHPTAPSGIHIHRPSRPSSLTPTLLLLLVASSPPW